jgi:peptidoglycan/LPS O-acetylase OafA/YrhL
LNTEILFKRPHGRNKVIDGFRAIAILWVFFFHCWLFHANIFEFTDQSYAVFESKFFSWVPRGDLGVDLFFVISGFLIGSILLSEYKKTQNIKFLKFYARRFFRLMPVYVIVMGMCIFFLDGLNFDKAYANLLYINNYIRDSYMTWTWSLAMEEQFYFIAPLFIILIFPLFKSKKLIFLLLFLLPIFLTGFYFHKLEYNLPFNNRLFHGDWEDWFWDYYVLTHLRFGSILAGFFAAYILVYKKEEALIFFQKKKRTNTLTFISLILIFLIGTTYTGHLVPISESIFFKTSYTFNLIYESIHRDLFCLLVAYLILASTCNAKGLIEKVSNFLSLNFWYPIAQISYSAYLFHIGFMMWAFPKLSSFFYGSVSSSSIIFINIIIAIFTTFIISSLLFLIVEMPCQKIGRNLIQRKSNKFFSP